MTTSHAAKSFATVLLVTAMVLSGCTSSDAHDVAEEEQTASSPTSQTPMAEETAPSLEEQVAAVTGRDDVVLEPIESAGAWLGGDDFEAYRDPATHSEFIVDTSRQMLYSYSPGTQVYQDPIDATPYPGEPSRDEVLELGDEWMIEYLPQFDISTMRRTALRRVSGVTPDGDMLEYSVRYRTYENGIEVPKTADVNITLPTWQWIPSRSAFELANEEADPHRPEIFITDALDAAAESAGYDEYVVQEVRLSWWEGVTRWSFELEKADPDPMDFGRHAAVVFVDPITGEAMVDAVSGAESSD
ncbi:MAG: hypothetical protein PF636_10510, partial [Actinomycetota bacterium]|nr:hypothetical protein [Actinomycetota bacterium]